MQTTIYELIIKHQKGKLTPEERIELNEFKTQSEENQQLVDDLTDPRHVYEAIRRSRKLDVEAAWQKTLEELSQPTISMARYYRVAAAVLVVAIGLGLFISKNSDKKEPFAKKDSRSSPYHHAILTMSNGRVLNLHEMNNGFLGEDRMIAKNDSQLIYPSNYHTSQPGMNILVTPKGNYYGLQLPDGSAAWLNSGSTIRYPNSFNGDKRIVMVQGEVYFEVEKNPSKPFIVQVESDGSEIQALGTRFTVNAYKDDSTVRTTLLEGKVKIKGVGYTDSLRPGEQLIAKAGRKVQKIKVGSAEDRVQGWRANKFKWVKTDLTTILEDLSHWYGYNLKYKTEIPSSKYDVIFDRFESLDNIFKKLHTGTGLNFKLEGATIVIYPQN